MSEKWIELFDGKSLNGWRGKGVDDKHEWCVAGVMYSGIWIYSTGQAYSPVDTYTYTTIITMNATS